MAGKVNAHHVVHFAFQELGSLPDSGDRRNRRIVLREARLEAKPLLKGKRVQVVDDFESQLIFRIVDRADIREMVEGCLRRIVQVARNLQQARGGHGDSGLGTCGVDAGRKDRVREFRLQTVEQSLHRSSSSRVAREKCALSRQSRHSRSVSRVISRTPSPAEFFPAASAIHRATLPGGADSPAHRHRPE